MAEDPVAVFEEIVTAEAQRIETEAAMHEAHILQLQRWAGITYAQALASYTLYGETITISARECNMSVEELMNAVPLNRRTLFLGMIIGAVITGNTLHFRIRPGASWPGQNGQQAS